MEQKGRAWIEIEKENLFHNVRQLKKAVGGGCALMPAVKANAYGHGAVLTAGVLQEMGIKNFCVACVREGIELREAGIGGQILVLGYTHPDEFEQLFRYELTQTVVDVSYAGQLSAFGKMLSVHVGIDTGMHRLGERSEDFDNIVRLWSLPDLKITGVFSHLCVADGASGEEKEFTQKQMEKFRLVVSRLHKAGLSDFKTHLQGSYGILNYPAADFDYARPGIALYGVLSSPGDKLYTKVDLRPALSLKARIGHIGRLHKGEGAGYGLTYQADSEQKAALVSIGYADGIPRELSNKGQALVRGRRAPFMGRVCMDQLLLNVTEIPEAAVGDEVVFIGRSCGEEISAQEMAKEAGTISNEILSRLGERLERILI